MMWKELREAFFHAWNFRAGRRKELGRLRTGRRWWRGISVFWRLGGAGRRGTARRTVWISTYVTSRVTALLLKTKTHTSTQTQYTRLQTYCTHISTLTHKHNYPLNSTHKLHKHNTHNTHTSTQTQWTRLNTYGKCTHIHRQCTLTHTHNYPQNSTHKAHKVHKPHTHTQIHTHTHTHKRTHTRAHKHARTHTNTHTYTHTQCTHTHTHMTKLIVAFRNFVSNSVHILVCSSKSVFDIES